MHSIGSFRTCSTGHALPLQDMQGIDRKAMGQQHVQSNPQCLFPRWFMQTSRKHGEPFLNASTGIPVSYTQAVSPSCIFHDTLPSPRIIFARGYGGIRSWSLGHLARQGEALRINFPMAHRVHVHRSRRNCIAPLHLLQRCPMCPINLLRGDPVMSFVPQIFYP